jgi:hypothetical protein
MVLGIGIEYTVADTIKERFSAKLSRVKSTNDCNKEETLCDSHEFLPPYPL